MNKALLYLLMIITLFITACSEDESVEKIIYNAKDIEGKWFCKNNATILDFALPSFSGSIYTDLDSSPKVAETISGSWMYFPKNNILRMDIHYANTSNSNTRDYKIISVDKNTLTLADIQLNTKFVFHKVVEDLEIAIGDDFDMNVSDFVPSSYSATPSTIVDVGSQGQVTTRNAGTVFVCAENASDAVYARLKINRVPCYRTELLGTIDDIFAKYGTPDFDEYVKNESMDNMRARYKQISLKDEGLLGISYSYDYDTREITNIETIYHNFDIFNEDLTYLLENYYDIYQDGTVYGQYPGIMKNDYNILKVFIDNGNYGEFIYVNQLYYRRNQHY